jgi:hypothetical protein
MMHIVSALALASVFGFAATAKLRDIGGFAAYLQPLVQGTPRRSGMAAVLIIASEIALAVALVSAAALQIRGPFVAATAFLLLVSVGQCWFIVKRVADTCLCFGSHKLQKAATENSYAKVAVFAIRNAVLLFVSGIASWGLPGAFWVSAIPPIAVGLALCIDTGRYWEDLRQSVPAPANTYARQFPRMMAQRWWVDGSPRPF